MRRRPIAVTVLLALLLLAAACGQKPGVSDNIEGPITLGGGGLPPGASIDEEGNIVDAEGNVIGNVEEGITDASALESASGGGGLGGTTTTTGGGDTGGGDTGGGDTGGGDTGGGDTGGPPPTGGNATGVTNEAIKIGIHAPLSGAAPVPSDSVAQGKDLYYRWMATQKKTLPGGRTVQAFLENDQYNPSTAVSVCKKMVEENEVFLLSGAAGTDQILACARYAQSVGVPYVSAGVTEQLVENFPTYFATSMTYPAQAPLLIDYWVSKLGAKGEKNAVVMYDTSSFNDLYSAFESAAADAGVSLAYKKRVSKNAGPSEARQVVQEMQLAQIENVFIISSPVWWLSVLKQADSQGYRPQWTGIGISMTFDTVANVGCRGGDSIDGSQFFSPFPAWFDSNRYDPAFRQASKQLSSKGEGDDFMWLSWSGSEVLWQMFAKTGEDITREKFIYTVERMRGLKNGNGPELNYSPTDHFGADTVFVSEARCSDNRWHTVVTTPTNNF